MLNWSGIERRHILSDSGPHEESTPFQGRATHRFAHCIEVEVALLEVRTIRMLRDKMLLRVLSFAEH